MIVSLLSNLKKGFTIRSNNDINNIITALANATKIKQPSRMKVNSDFYHLKLYAKEKKSPEIIRVLFNTYHGTVISAGDFYYTGDRLDKVIKTVKAK